MSEISISTSSPISELVTHVKHSFRERDFIEVQKILMGRENDMKMEIRNLIRARDSAEKKICLLERAVDLKELERLKLDEKLQKNQRKCEDLEETITRLLEEKGVSNDREERAMERCDKFSTENFKMTNEKHKLIFELNEKVKELKNKNLENERLAGVCEEKYKRFDTMVAKIGQEIEDLRHEKLAAVKTVEELKRENSEANKTIEELRLKKSESDKAAEVYKSRLENLLPRMEEALADMGTVKVGDLANLVNDVRKLVNSEEEGSLEFPYFRGKNDSSRIGMKMEIENLMRDRDSAKKEVCLLERKVDIKELEIFKLDEKLQKSLRKCEELEETVIRLIEEKRVSNDREKRVEERCDKITAENSKMTNEKIKSIFELNEKINELKNKNLENERLVGVYQEKCKCLDIEIVKIGQEIEEMGLKQLESDRFVEELKGRIFEANKIIDELRFGKSESDKVAEVYNSRLDNLSPRIRKIEENHANMLTVKVGDIANLVNDVRNSSNSEVGGKLRFSDSRGKNDSSRNGSTLDDAEDLVVLSPGVRSDFNSTGTRSFGLSNKGDRKLVQCSTREDDARTVKPSPASQSGHDSPLAESNECKEPPVSGTHASGTRLISGAGRFSKTALSSYAGGEIIHIIDSDADDEENPAQAPDFSNVGEHGINFIQSPVSSQRSKRKNRTDRVEDLFTNFISKRKNNTCAGIEDIVLVGEKENEVVKSTQDKIDCSKNLGRTFIYEADMLRAFQQDEQLCMNAVCALYRQQFVARKSKGRSDLSESGGFSPVDSIRGCALAEYLIDGDKELRLRKSVSEVEKQKPEVIGQCRKLANVYIEKLFAIYCRGEDPLFGQ